MLANGGQVRVVEVLYLVRDRKVCEDKTRLHYEVFVEIVTPGQLRVHTIHKVENLVARVYAVPVRGYH